MVHMERDHQRFEVFARDVRPVLLQFARKLCHRSGLEPEDLVQETLERAFQDFSKLGSTNDGVRWGWLSTTLHNRFLDLCRRRRTEMLGLPVLRVIQPEAVSPEDEFQGLWASFSPEQFRAAVAHLEPKLRDVYELRATGLRYREIASRLDIPVGTVGAWLSEARQALRQLLTEGGARS